MTAEKIEEMVRCGKLREHHWSWNRGYVSRKGNGVVREYNGKFGKGYTVESPSWKTTRYDYITYYIFVE